MTAATLDLVLLAKLEAVISADSLSTRHIYYASGTGQDPTRRETSWVRVPKPLGVGGVGTVYREQCIEGEAAGAVRAVKSIPKPIAQGKRKISYSEELQAIARFSQPQYEQYFVKSYGWYDTIDTLYLAMEFVPLGDLQRYLADPFPVQETQCIISQMLCGLSIMHNQGYAHRDLKPANLLVFHHGPQWHVKIVDFGLSKRIVADATSFRTQAGTMGFMAPEVLGLGPDEDDSSDEESQSYTNAVDIWAVGTITFLLLTGSLPFPEPRALRRYVTGKVLFPSDALSSKEVGISVQTLIKSLLAVRAVDRPTAEILLRHGWLSGSYDQIRTNENATPTTRTMESASIGWTTVDSGLDIPGTPQSTDSPHIPESPVLSIVEELNKLNSATRNGEEISMAAGMSNDQEPHHRSSSNVHEDLPETYEAAQMSIASQTTLGGHMDAVWDVVFSPDGKIAASGSFDGKLRFWDVSASCVVSETEIDGLRMVFSPDSRVLAVVLHASPSALLLEAATGKEIRMLTVQPTLGDNARNTEPNLQHLRSVSFSSNGEVVASASQQGIVTLWSTSTGRLIREINTGSPFTSERGRIHRQHTCEVTFSPNGKYIVTCGSGRRVQFWDLDTGINHDGRVDPEGTDQLWRHPSHGQSSILRRDSSVKTFYDYPLVGEIRDKDVSRATFAPDGKLMVATIVKTKNPGRSLERLELWDTAKAATNHGSWTRTLECEQVNDIAFSPSGRFAAAICRRTTFVSPQVRLWDVRLNFEVKRLGVLEGRPHRAVFVTDDRCLVTGTYLQPSGQLNNKIRLWEINISAENTTSG